ncbi:MAG: tyrosine-type recombinase/integrase [Aureispira sp.]
MSSILRFHEQFCQHSLVFKNNAPTSVKSFRYTFLAFLEMTGVSSFDQITQECIEDYVIQGKLEKKWSPKTIRNHLQYLSLFLDWCVKRNHLEKNYAKEIEKPKLPKTLPKSLSKDQATRLLEWAEHYSYYYSFERTRAICIIATFIFTGIRLQELYNLKVSHVNVTDKVLVVRSGKGNKDRIIPLNGQLIHIIKEYLRQREKRHKTTPYFFTSLRKNDKMGQKTVEKLVKKLREVSGIYFYPHLLRHTFATLMVEGGCDIYSLSKMMGHSDIQTTTIYLNVSTKHLKHQILKHPVCW